MDAKRWLVPLGVFTAVVTAVVAMNVVDVGGGGSSATPRRLPVSLSAGGRSVGGVASAGEGSADSKMAPGWYGGGQYRLARTFSGLPAEGPAYQVGGGRADEDDVRRLARALGLSGEPQRTDSGWQVGTSGPVLVVADGGGQRWDFQRIDTRCAATEGPDCAVAVDNASGTASDKGSGSTSGSGSASSPAVGCAAPPPGAEPAPDVACKPVEQPSPPPGPSDEETRTVAKRVLAAAGIDMASAYLWTVDGWGSRIAFARPEVGGLPAFGLDAVVTVMADGSVSGAGGWLGVPKSEGTYPLLTPQQAVDRGGSGPQIAIGRPCDAKTPECTGGEPRDVTGVRLGLTALWSYDESPDMFLAPAWVLTVEGSDQEEPLLALPDEYLTPPLTAEPDPVPEPDGSGAAGSGAPGSTGTSDPVPPVEEPAPAKS